MRVAAHEAFDVLWKGGSMSRYQAYGWLANKMGLTTDEAHIGRFTAGMCRRLIALVGERNAQA